jgi:hypothetical protein
MLPENCESLLHEKLCTSALRSRRKSLHLYAATVSAYASAGEHSSSVATCEQAIVDVKLLLATNLRAVLAVGRATPRWWRRGFPETSETDWSRRANWGHRSRSGTRAVDWVSPGESSPTAAQWIVFADTLVRERRYVHPRERPASNSDTLISGIRHRLAAPAIKSNFASGESGLISGSTPDADVLARISRPILSLR